MSNSGWDASAAAWIQSMGKDGDEGRRFVLDPAFSSWLEGREFENALDVGCGEGRLSRMLAQRNIPACGIDPTHALIERARELHPSGDYRIGSAEELPFPDGEFDLVLSCLSLIDIPDFRSAIREMVRVLRPGGTLLVMNLTAIATAGAHGGWQRDAEGRRRGFMVDDYGTQWSAWAEWDGIRIKNWHRPLSGYMQTYLECHLTLVHFDEPPYVGSDEEGRDRYTRAPWFNLMEWRKPARDEGGPVLD